MYQKMTQDKYQERKPISAPPPLPSTSPPPKSAMKKPKEKVNDFSNLTGLPTLEKFIAVEKLDDMGEMAGGGGPSGIGIDIGI